MAIQVLYKLKSLEERVKQVVIETENQIGKLVVEPYIEAARKKYSDNKKVIEYLDALEENIIESIYYFYCKIFLSGSLDSPEKSACSLDFWGYICGYQNLGCPKREIA